MWPRSAVSCSSPLSVNTSSGWLIFTAGVEKMWCREEAFCTAFESNVLFTSIFLALDLHSMQNKKISKKKFSFVVFAFVVLLWVVQQENLGEFLISDFRMKLIFYNIVSFSGIIYGKIKTASQRETNILGSKVNVFWSLMQLLFGSCEVCPLHRLWSQVRYIHSNITDLA